MKKLTALLLVLAFACSPDIEEFQDPFTEIPEALEIIEVSELKLESFIVYEEVRINAKLPSEGQYRIKIRDISNKVVSQEKVDGAEGDNLLKIYVRTLPASSYSVELLTNSNQVLGRSTFGVKKY